MKDWNAKAYERYHHERMQPSIDLVRRIEKCEAEMIIDMGCGSGMSTLQLANRWPKAKLIGVDYSESMLEQARQLPIQVEWVKRDCNKKLSEFKGADIIFSNASLQWLDYHEVIIKEWFELLNDGGILAIQIPLFDEMEAQECINKVRSSEKWKHYFIDIEKEKCHNDSADCYYDRVSRWTNQVEMWTTDYYHILESQAAIIDFISSTALRPYVNRIQDQVLWKDFLKELEEQLKVCYPFHENGKVIFKFKRLFMIAIK